jgi:hypothetical protein
MGTIFPTLQIPPQATGREGFGEETRMKADWGFIALPAIGVGLIGFMLFGLPFILALGSESTGVCIFKGQATYGFLSSSDGVPLRGIGVTAYFINGWGNKFTIAEGSTDRTGCFIFQSNHSSQFVGYTYNGTSYIDTVQQGVVLRDNVP